MLSCLFKMLQLLQSTEYHSHSIYSGHFALGYSILFVLPKHDRTPHTYNPLIIGSPYFCSRRFVCFTRVFLTPTGPAEVKAERTVDDKWVCCAVLERYDVAVGWSMGMSKAHEENGC